MSMVRNMTLKSQLLMAISFVAFFLVIVGCIGMFALRQVTKKAEHIATVNVVNSVLLGTMLAKSKGIEADTYHLIGAALRGEDVGEFRDSIQEGFDDYEKTDKMFLSGERSAEEQTLYNQQNSSWEILKPTIVKFIELVDGSDQNKADELSKLAFGEFSKASVDHLKKLEALFLFQNDEGYKWAGAVKSTARNGNLASLISIIVGFLFAIAIGIAFSSKLSKKLTLLAQEIAHGAELLHHNAGQMARTSEALSLGSKEQGATLERTASALHQVSSMVEQNSASSATSATSASESQKSAEEGERAVKEVEKSILEISKSTDKIATEIKSSNDEFINIVKIISEIGEKTKVINDIVFQTKLLSFNASVEAARAGEHGKGFAVVAEEVGNLAQMSGNASKEISSLLQSSIEKVESTVSRTSQRVNALIAEGRSKVELGSNTAATCRKVLEKIVASVGTVNDAIHAIATASDEQALAVREIDKAVSELSEATQSTTNAAADSAVLAGELNSHVLNLEDIVTRLQETVEGVAATERRKSLATQGEAVPFLGKKKFKAETMTEEVDMVG